MRTYFTSESVTEGHPSSTLSPHFHNFFQKLISVFRSVSSLLMYRLRFHNELSLLHAESPIQTQLLHIRRAYLDVSIANN